MALKLSDDDGEEIRREYQRLLPDHHGNCWTPSDASGSYSRRADGAEEGGMANGSSRFLSHADRPNFSYPLLKSARKKRSRFHIFWPKWDFGWGQMFGSVGTQATKARSVLGNVRPQDVKMMCTGGLSLALKCSLILLARVFLEKSWRCLQVASVCTLCLCPLKSLLPQAAKTILQPLHSWVGPVLGLTLSQPLMGLAWPDGYRTARFWRRLFPIYFAYMRTKQIARHRNAEDRAKIWAKTHEWGGLKVHQLVLDMSGFYVKSAQILASKSDFVPEAWIKHLSSHLDDQPPRPFSQVALSIRKQLKECHRGPFLQVDNKGLVPLDAVFSYVDSTPVASASIAQVHGAVLKNGTRVVVKVQHLGMETYMRSDLRNIAWVAKFLQGQLPFDLTAVVKEIQDTIPLEFNFEREVWFMTRIKESLQSHGFGQIVCPSPCKDLCTKFLIVMQRIDGIPFTRILHPGTDNDIRRRSTELVPLVEQLLHAYGQMLLVDGIFHADPHAGNLLLLPDGRLGLIDFGQSKILETGTRMMLVRLVRALAEGTDAEIAHALTDTGMLFEDVRGHPVSDSTLAMMARIMFDTCYVEEATVSPMSDKSVLRTFPLTSFNQALWLVVRTIVILRGLCFQLNMNVSAAAIWNSFAATQLEKPDVADSLT